MTKKESVFKFFDESKMKPYTKFQLREHLRWLYSRPNYYEEGGINDKRRRHNKRKNLSSLDPTL